MSVSDEVEDLDEVDDFRETDDLARSDLPDLPLPESADADAFASSASLGDSSSTIICQRISFRIPYTVQESSKKVNSCFLIPFLDLHLISVAG